MPKRELPRGISFHNGKYQASIRVNHKLIYLGRHSEIESAQQAYDDACLKYFGELPPS